MHALAARVRELPNTSLTIYRVGGDYLALVRGDDPEFAAALYPHVHGTLEFVECELVTSSDLQRRHRRR